MSSHDITSLFPPSGNEGYVRNRNISYQKSQDFINAPCVGKHDAKQKSRRERPPEDIASNKKLILEVVNKLADRFDIQEKRMEDLLENGKFQPDRCDERRGS